MQATQLLNNLGQSLWLDNITRDLLTSGTLGGVARVHQKTVDLAKQIRALRELNGVLRPTSILNS